MKTFVFLVVVTSLASSMRVSAQPVIRTAGNAYYVSGNERWLYPGEIANRTRWQPLGESLEIDSISTAAGARVFDSRRGNNSYEARTRVWRSVRGGIDSVSVGVSHNQSQSAFPERQPQGDEQRALQDASVAAQAVKFLDLYPMFLGGATPAESPAQINIRIRVADLAYAIVGTVVTRPIGDTVVAGQSMLLLRDSGFVELSTDVPRWERTLFGVRLDQRRVSGTLITRRVYDAARDITISAADSTALVGRETRRYADGRQFSTDVRFDRVRTVALLDSVALGERKAEVARRYPFGVGMVIRAEIGDQTPDTRNPRVQDSLLNAYSTATTVADRQAIERVRNFLYEPGIRERLAKSLVSQGDTANALRLISLEFGSTLTKWLYQLVRPILNDPVRAMHYNVSANGLYEAFEYQFKNYPIVLASDTTDAWCVPSVCRLVAAEWDSAAEPRLRTIGLMARYSTDPAQWAEGVIEEEARGNRQLTAIGLLARGVNGNSAETPGIPIPTASDGWREWLRWLRGAPDDILARRDSVTDAMRARMAAVSTLQPRTESRRSVTERLHIGSTWGLRDLIDLSSLRFDVSYRDTIALRLASAPVDTARFVYGYLANALKIPPVPAEQIERTLRSSSELDRALARMQLRQLRFEPADSATAQAIEDVLLGRLLDGAPLWTPLDERPFSWNTATQIRKKDSTFIVADSLTATSRDRLQQAGVAVRNTSWNLPLEASGRLVRISGVSRSGPFVRVSLGDTYLVRLADGRGGGNDQGGVFWLVFLNGEWRLIDEDSWVT